MRKSQINDLIDFMKTPRTMEEIKKFTGKSIKSVYRYFERIEREYGLIDKKVGADGKKRYKVRLLKNKNVIEKAFYKSLEEFKDKKGIFADEIEVKSVKKFTKDFANVFIKHLEEASCEKLEYMREHTAKILQDIENINDIFYSCEYPWREWICIDACGIRIYVYEDRIRGDKPRLQITKFKYLMQHIESGYPSVHADINRLLEHRDTLYNKMYNLIVKIWRRARKLSWPLKEDFGPKVRSYYDIPMIVYILYEKCLYPKYATGFKDWYDMLEKKENVQKVLDEKLIREALEVRKMVIECIKLENRIRSFIKYLKDIKRYGGILKGECDVCRTYKTKFYE